MANTLGSSAGSQSPKTLSGCRLQCHRNISQSTKILTASILMFVFIGAASSYVLGSRPLSKRSFFDIQCKGVYNKEIFAKLENICHDCYNLYRDSELYSLCRSNCFGSDYFKGCLEALLLTEEESKYDEMIEVLGKKK